MADFHVYRDRLEIRLTRAEKVLSLRRDDLVIPRDSIRSVAITADPWIWIRGVRAPGNSIPLTLAVGTWKFHGGKDFLVLKGKQRAAVVIDIEQPDAAAIDEQAALDAGAATSTDESANDVEAGSAARLEPADASTAGASESPDGAATPADGAAPADAAAATAPTEVANGFSRVIVSTQHASRLVEALRDIHPGSDGPVDKVIA